MVSITSVLRGVGFAVTVVGGIMFFPALLEFYQGTNYGPSFALASAITTAVGTSFLLGFQRRTNSSYREYDSISNSYIIYILIWLAVPMLGTLPFMFGQQTPTLVDAFFESVSGFTTTGATIYADLDSVSPGILLWRGLSQWLGGIAVVVLGLTFLTQLRVGGMELFRGAVSIHADDQQANITSILRFSCIIYLILTLFCAFAYLAFGMSPFEAAVHAMTTVATGGFGTRDSSFADFNPAIEYVAVLFMVLAALPFITYIKLPRRYLKAIFDDSQIRAFLGFLLGIVVTLTIWLLSTSDQTLEPAFRKALFNVVSITTGTGYTSTDYASWGGFAVTVFFLIGLVGGCSGSTTCSIKIFRYQILAVSLIKELKLIRNPHSVQVAYYQGKRLAPEIISSITSFLFLFVASLVVLTALLSLTGLDLITAASGAASALANIGPGLGTIIGPTGNYAELPNSAKWLLAGGMLLGRLEIVLALVLVQLPFVRRV